ncbi:hypothetical protein OROMI_032396 [Orobanche minor]
MVTTRSMSRSNLVILQNSNMKTTKKVTKNAVKPPKFIVERNSTRNDALSIFMIKEYLKQYYEANTPRPTIRLIPHEVIRSGHVKWFYMSETEKAPWIELAKKMKAEGPSIFVMKNSMVY